MIGSQFRTVADIKKLSEAEIYEIAQERLSMMISRVKSEPAQFIFGYAYTLDQQDKVQPIKLFPRKQYLEEIIRIWQNERMLLMVKSRQMTMTWLFVALCLWDTMFHQGRSYFFVSKKEEDADFLVKRALFIYQHLPKYMQIPMTERYCLIKFPQINSEIQGVSQESDALRTRTASGILSDEMAFQPYAREAYQAMRPTIEAGGKFCGISTPNGKNFFYNCLFDLE